MSGLHSAMSGRWGGWNLTEPVKYRSVRLRVHYGRSQLWTTRVSDSCRCFPASFVDWQARTMGNLPRKSSHSVLSWAVGLVVLAVAAVSVYFRVFTGFSPWDDEGYFGIGLRSFLRGRALYDQIYSVYGPFYYLLESAIYSVLRIPVTHNAIRFITLFWWLVSALLCGWLGYRLTRSRLLGGAAFFAGIKLIVFFVGSPGHPEELCLALMLAILALACEIDRGRRWTIILLGVLLAALALTKINAGVFMGAAVALALLRASPPAAWQQTAFGLVALASGALPFVILLPLFAQNWASQAALFLALSIAASCLVTWRARLPRWMLPRNWLMLIAGFASSAAIVIGLLVLHGATVRAMLQMTVLEPAGYLSQFYIPLRVNPAIPSISFLLAVAWCGCQTRRRARRRSQRWLNWLKGLLGVLGCLLLLDLLMLPTVSGSGFESTYNVALILFNLIAPFSWLVVVPPSAPTLEANRYARIALCLTGALAGAYAVPVAGAQLVFATTLLIPVLCVFWNDFSRTLQAESVSVSRRWGAMRAAAALILAAAFPLDLRQNIQAYRTFTPLPMPGADRIRVPRSAAAAYQWVTGELQRNSCATVFSFPGMFSLNLWTNLHSPTYLAFGDWLAVFNEEQQGRVASDLAAAPAPCVVLCPSVAAMWWRGQDTATSKLLRYINHEFAPVAKADGFHVLIRKDRFGAAKPPAATKEGRAM